MAAEEMLYLLMGRDVQPLAQGFQQQIGVQGVIGQVAFQRIETGNIIPGQCALRLIILIALLGQFVGLSRQAQ